MGLDDDRGDLAPLMPPHHLFQCRNPLNTIKLITAQQLNQLKIVVFVFVGKKREKKEKTIK